MHDFSTLFSHAPFCEAGADERNRELVVLIGRSVQSSQRSPVVIAAPYARAPFQYLARMAA
jgi:hypothetical protein